MSLDLQWFAKDGEGGEKTEQPTAKKLSDARNDGKVAKSRELDNAVGLLLLFILLQVTMSTLGGGMLELFETFYNRIPEFLDENSTGMTARSVSQMIQRAVSYTHLLARIPSTQLTSIIHASTGSVIRNPRMSRLDI